MEGAVVVVGEVELASDVAEEGGFGAGGGGSVGGGALPLRLSRSEPTKDPTVPRKEGGVSSMTSRYALRAGVRQERAIKREIRTAGCYAEPLRQDL